MSPGSTIDTSPYRISSTSESSLRTRWRSQSGGGGCHARTVVAPSRSRSPACTVRQGIRRASARAARSVRPTSRGTGTPSHNSRGRNISSAAPAPPAWSASPCVTASTSSLRTPKCHSAGATTRSPTSKRAVPPRPPASTSSVRPDGNRTKVASPCPTSSTTMRSRAGDGQGGRGAATISSAPASREEHGDAARCPVPWDRPPHPDARGHERDQPAVVERDEQQRGRRHTPREPRHVMHERRRRDEPQRSLVRHPAGPVCE